MAARLSDYPVTSVPADTLSMDPPMIPPWIRCLAFNRTLLTYGDGSAHVERTSGPANVIDAGRVGVVRARRQRSGGLRADQIVLRRDE